MQVDLFSGMLLSQCSSTVNKYIDEMLSQLRPGDEFPWGPVIIGWHQFHCWSKLSLPTCKLDSAAAPSAALSHMIARPTRPLEEAPGL
jgi:hypothetical protein